MSARLQKRSRSTRPRKNGRQRTEVLRVNGLQVVGPRGKVVAEISNFKDAGFLALNGPDGKRIADISCHEGGGALGLYGPAGEMFFAVALTGIDALAGPDPVIIMHKGNKAGSAVQLRACRQGGQVKVYDSRGLALGRLGAFDLNEVGGGILDLRGKQAGTEVRNGQIKQTASAETIPMLRGTGKLPPARRKGRAPSKMGFAFRLERHLW